MERTMLKAVFHVDELAKMKLMLENARNYITWCKENETPYELHLVANSEAVLGFSAKKTKYGEEIAALQRDGAEFFVCKNAMGNFHMTESDLPGNVSIVPSGVVALARLQQAGFAYIRP